MTLTMIAMEKSMKELLTFFIDSDEDGYGSESVVLSCTQPIGTADNDDDCNDLSAVAFLEMKRVAIISIMIAMEKSMMV